MSDEVRTVMGVLHVDPDAPNTVTSGDRVWTWFDPAPEGAEPQTLPSAWKSVGHVSMESVSLDAIRAFIGLDVSPLRSHEASAMSMHLTYLACPVVKPVKRRGLTGKRYRIARRRYAREMRAYRRGEIAPVARALYLPRVKPTASDVATSILGVSAQFMVLDEADGSPWYDLSTDR